MDQGLARVIGFISELTHLSPEDTFHQQHLVRRQHVSPLVHGTVMDSRSARITFMRAI